MRYHSYQLKIDSQIELPELCSYRESDFSPDATIIRGSVPKSGLKNGTQLSPFLWVNPTSLWLQVPKVARFLVQNGSKITIEPEPGIDEESIRVFLLGSAFGALLFQRGYLVLHGNAIQIGNQCMVCVGHSGTGKSTLAAGFMQRGYTILADDVVPVDSDCCALPGFPRIKLWQDVADKMAIDTSSLNRICPSLEKFNFPVSDNYCSKALPIRWIYILDNHPKDDFLFEPITGMHRFLPLYNNTYRAFFLEGMELQPNHLKLCGQLASRIHLARVIRPTQGFELNALVDHILAHIKDNP